MDHTFSIDLRSKEFVKRMSISDDSRDGVYFEGSLGEIKELGFVHGGMLEIKGVNATLRIDLGEEELRAISPTKVL